MHKAILHIGTEKTGSTAIQNFLHKNKKKLRKLGILFPYRSCGSIGNFRLVLLCKSEPDPGLCAMEARFAPSELTRDLTNRFEQWKSDIAKNHILEIENFRRKRRSSTIVYSSEHFHSRLTTVEEVQRVKDILDQLYDDISVLVYLRRQDRMALSAHNTSIQGGDTRPFDLDAIKGTPRYYDHLSLMKLWSGVFGKHNIHPIAYDKDQLVHNDVVKDFESKIEPTNQVRRFIYRKFNFVYEKSNSRLSHTALSMLVEFNKLDAGDPLLNGQDKEEIRPDLIEALHAIKDEYGEHLPQRSIAESFYTRFKDDNDEVFSQWSNSKGLSTDFSMYPVQADTFPMLEVSKLLKNNLEDLLH